MSNQFNASQRKLLDKELLTDQDLLFLLRVSKSTLRRYRQKGVLRFFKMGNNHYYFTRYFIEYIEQQSHNFYKKNFKDNPDTLDDEKTNAVD